MMEYKISELIGKQAITLSDAGQQGVILDAFFDKNLTKCKGFSLLSGDDENNFYVDFKEFSALNRDAAVIRSDLSLKTQPWQTFAESPINLPAFNQDGKSLGVIRDISMSNDTVVSFVTDGGDEIAAGLLLSRSDNLVVFNDTGSAIKIKKPIKKSGTAKKENTDNVADITAKTEELNADSLAAPKLPFGRLRPFDAKISGAAGGGTESTARQGNPILSKYSFLLGKRLQRSIYAHDGKLIAKENELVTEKIIGLAKESGKLVAVALHSI